MNGIPIHRGKLHMKNNFRLQKSRSPPCQFSWQAIPGPLQSRVYFPVAHWVWLDEMETDI
jgi:hypothetical protein